MFLSLDDGLQRLWLAELFLLWAGLLFGGFAFGQYRPAERRRMPTWTRIGSSAALVLAAVTWAIVTNRGFLIAPVTGLIAGGMLLGFIGDLALAGWLTEWLQIRSGFLVGMAAFSVGHLLYSIALVVLAAIIGLTNGTAFAVSLGIALALGVIGWFFAVARAKDHRSLRFPALAYALLLSATAGCATALAAQSAYFIPVAIGAALFMVSDLLVAGEKFGTLRIPWQGDLVWLTYGPAQALIVFSAEFTLRYLAR